MRRALSAAPVALALLFAALPAGFATLASAQPAQGVFYDCDMKASKRYGGWISSKIGIVLLPDGRTVVSDRVTLNYGVSTVLATITRQSDRDLRLNWQVTGGLREGKYLLPDAVYSAKISKQSNNITVRGKFSGSRGSFSGRGHCTVRTK